MDTAACILCARCTAVSTQGSTFTLYPSFRKNMVLLRCEIGTISLFSDQFSWNLKDMWIQQQRVQITKISVCGNILTIRTAQHHHITLCHLIVILPFKVIHNCVNPYSWKIMFSYRPLNTKIHTSFSVFSGYQIYGKMKNNVGRSVLVLDLIFRSNLSNLQPVTASINMSGGSFGLKTENIHY